MKTKESICYSVRQASRENEICNAEKQGGQKNLGHLIIKFGYFTKFRTGWAPGLGLLHLILKYNTPGLLPGIKTNYKLFTLTEPSLANGYFTICIIS